MNKLPPSVAYILEAMENHLPALVVLPFMLIAYIIYDGG